MFPASSLVFVTDVQAKYVPARVSGGAIQPGQPGMVALLDDNGRPKFQLELPGSMTATLIRMDEESLTSVPDMVELKVLTEASLLHNLRLRFRNDDIYTAIGDVLIALNPYKMLPLYTPLVVDSYIASSSPTTSAPHVYKVADLGFRRLVELKKSQACMVTGESGSGKTETTKIFLQYLAEVSSAWSNSRRSGTTIESALHSPASSVSNAALSDKILKSNPLLESFGNASTRKNANSSRFGKLIEVFVDTNSAEIVSARTTIFLLEKSRLPAPAAGERNFHIFYQMCAGARVHPEIRDQYEVLDLDEYRYLQFGSQQQTRVSDIMGWEELMKSMKVLKIPLEVRDEALRIVSGVLHLGNIEFELDEAIHHSQASKIGNPSSLQTAERLLGMTDLAKALTLKSVSAATEVVSQHQPVEKAKKLRDALAISIYSGLFTFLATRINDTIQINPDDKSSASRRTMGVLDIFGFESFPGANNSFEQLCINYCNEKLQHQFNEYVFLRERAEYEREGVSISSNPSALLEKSQKNTQLVLELFERPRTGLFHLMDQESQMPGGSDASLLKRMVHDLTSWNPSFEPAKKDLFDVAFVVRHYAGPVTYKVAGLMEKNDEGSLSKDLQLLCARSSLDIIRNSPALPKSHLGTQFAAQLDSLVKSLAEMEPHFVRCIKPSVERKAGLFSAGMVLDQLRYAGILEVCKIRQLGFPIRRDFAEFKNRFGALSTRQAVKKLLKSGEDIKQAVETLCFEFRDSKLLLPDNFACGKTKIFLKSFALTALEEKLEKMKIKNAVIIQRRLRGSLARLRMQQCRKALEKIANATQESNLVALRDGLGDESIKRLLGGGKHLKIVQAGWKRAAQLQEQTFGRNLIRRALNSQDPHAIKSALMVTASIVPQQEDIVVQAQRALGTLESDETAIAKLEERASDAHAEDIAELNALIERANDVLSRRENEPAIKRRVDLALEKAKAKLTRVQAESETRKQLEEGLNKKTEQVVAQATTKLRAIGVSNEDALIRRASLFLKEDLDRQKMLDEEVSESIQWLQSTMDARDADAISMAMVRVISEGLESHPVAESAIKLEKSLRKSQKDEQSISDVASIIEMKSSNKEGGGLAKEDLDLAEQVREEVEDEALKIKAEKIVATAQEIIEAQNGLHAALALGPAIEFNKLRQTLERAYAAGLTGGELVYRVQKMMRAKHRERRLAKKGVVFDLGGNVPEKRKKKPTMDMAAFQAEKLERSQANMLITMAKSEGDRYVISNYYQIRPRLDGDPPFIQHRKGRVLENPILETTSNAQAETISKLILGYTGERSVSFPPTCARTLLEMGVEAVEVADEIYVQLCAHLTENNNAESATRTWQLLCLIIATFFPSQDMLLFVVRFLLDRAEGRTDAALGAERPARGPLPTTMDNYTLEQRYAWYCLKKLQKDLASPDQAQPPIPTLEEIQAYGERVPVVINVTLPDGTVLIEDALVTPLMTVQDVTKMCLVAMRIAQPELHPTYGIFARPVDKAAMAAIVSSQNEQSQKALRDTASMTSMRESSTNGAIGESGEPAESPITTDSKHNALRSSLRLQKASSRNRFRLSITAVFGFGRSRTTEPGSPELPSKTAEADNEATVFSISQRSKAVGTMRGNHAAPAARKTTQISVRRTEDEIDWDVPLVPQEHVGDVLLRYLRAGRGAPRLVFKKRIFLPEFDAKAEEARKAGRSVEMAETQLAVSRIDALQAIDDFSTGCLPFDKEDDVAEVVVARVALKFDNKLPATDPERLLAIGQVDLFIPAPWRQKKSELNWARALLEKKGKIIGKDSNGLQMKILERCKSRPLYGSQLFRVTKKGELLESILAVSQRGLAVYSIKDHKVMAEYEFSKLEEIKLGRGSTVALYLKRAAGTPEADASPSKPVSFTTPHAREIVELAKEYQQVATKWDAKQDTPAAATTLMVESHEIAQQPSTAIESPISPTAAAENGGTRHNMRASSMGEDLPSDEPAESLRDRMVKMGASDGEIADVLRV